MPRPILSGGDIVLTSGHAVAADLQGRRVWCVGPRTADAARDAGAQVLAQAPTVRALADMLPGRTTSLTYLRGEEVSADLPALLSGTEIRVSQHVVYRQVPLDLPVAIHPVLRASSVIAPLWSAASARRLLGAWPDGARGPHLVSISAGVDAVWTAPSGSRVVADRPDGPAMIQAIAAALRATPPC